MARIGAGTVKPGGQVDAGGRPRIQSESKVIVDWSKKLIYEGRRRVSIGGVDAKACCGPDHPL